MKNAEQQPMGELLLYETEDGRSRVECRFQDESLWLSQALMAELSKGYETHRPNDQPILC